MLVPAPGRLSTTTCCPSCSERLRATMRASTSGALPGVEGATRVIGREGESCACATSCSARATAKRQMETDDIFPEPDLQHVIVSRLCIGHLHRAHEPAPAGLALVCIS